MPWTDAFAPIEADYRMQVRQETWGHLAPVRDMVYQCRVVYAVGCFGSDDLNPTPIFSSFKDEAGEELSDSPWLYEEIVEFMSTLDNQPGFVYELSGVFKNYEFAVERKVLLIAG